ncbi:unnamed protein product [Malus baccata var. baccata]
MQTVKLPASVCKKVDQLNKRFLWGGSADKAKVHLSMGPRPETNECYELGPSCQSQLENDSKG